MQIQDVVPKGCWSTGYIKCSPAFTHKRLSLPDLYDYYSNDKKIPTFFSCFKNLNESWTDPRLRYGNEEMINKMFNFGDMENIAQLKNLIFVDEEDVWKPMIAFTNVREPIDCHTAFVSIDAFGKVSWSRFCDSNILIKNCICLFCLKSNTRCRSIFI